MSITGIEQYSLERAGYFVRRGIASGNTNVSDLLGIPGIADVICDFSRGTAEPSRTSDLDVSIQFQRSGSTSWPHPETAGYFVIVALGEVDELYLSPGSHLAPQRVLTRVRLGLGDVVFLVNGVVGEVQAGQMGVVFEFGPRLTQ